MHMNDMNLGLVWTGALCLVLGLSGCTNETDTGLSAPGGTPVRVLAEIAPVTKSGTTRAVSTDNDFDRGTFLTGDNIKVTRTNAGASTVSQESNYRYDASSWVVVGNLPVTLEPAATYTAKFPADYDGIKQYQNTDGYYLASNLLETEPVSSSDGTLNFTNTNGKPFKHVNSKITLEFTVNRTTTTIANDAVALEAAGLRTNVSTTQSITLFRPYPSDASRKYEWCGIVRSINASTSLAVSLTCDGVTYKVTLTDCPLKAGYHYKYKLTLHNDLLIPESCTIGKWTDEIMSGGNLA